MLTLSQYKCDASLLPRTVQLSHLTEFLAAVYQSHPRLLLHETRHGEFEDLGWRSSECECGFVTCQCLFEASSATVFSESPFPELDVRILSYLQHRVSRPKATMSSFLAHYPCIPCILLVHGFSESPHCIRRKKREPLLSFSVLSPQQALFGTLQVTD